MRPEPAEIQAVLQKLNGWMTLIEEYREKVVVRHQRIWQLYRYLDVEG